MADLIEREWVLKRVQFAPDADVVKMAPAVEAVPVVRCMDCKHRGMSNECPFRQMMFTEADGYHYVDMTTDDDYCSFGEMEDDQHE